MDTTERVRPPNSSDGLSEHRRASASMFLFLCVLFTATFGLSRLHIEGEGAGWSFRKDAVVGIYGQISLSGAAGPHTDALTRPLMQVNQLANDIEPEVPFLSGIAPLVGLFLSGRRRHGPAIGVVAGVLSVFLVLNVNGQIPGLLLGIDWPLPVDASLETSWGFWPSIGLSAAAVAWNLTRLQSRRRWARLPAD